MPQTGASCIEDGVSNRSRGDCDCRLSRPGCGHIGRCYKERFDWGHLVIKMQTVVSLPVDRGDALVVPCDFFHQGATHPLQDAAFGLISETIGVSAPHWIVHPLEPALCPGAGA